MPPSPKEKQHRGGRWQKCWRTVRKTAGLSGQLEVAKINSHPPGHSLELKFLGFFLQYFHNAIRLP